MRIIEGSSDVCSSDLSFCLAFRLCPSLSLRAAAARRRCCARSQRAGERANQCDEAAGRARSRQDRSEEHTSELQSLMRISYAVFCLKKKKRAQIETTASHKNTNQSYIQRDQTA